MSYIDKTKVKEQAQGKWSYIFGTLASCLFPAMKKAGKHVACPVHGGKDGFRLFPNFNKDGRSVCNTCGMNNDGIATLMFANGWNFETTLNAIHKTINGDVSDYVEEYIGVSYVGRVKGWDGKVLTLLLEDKSEKQFYEDSLGSFGKFFSTLKKGDVISFTFRNGLFENLKVKFNNTEVLEKIRTLVNGKDSKKGVEAYLASRGLKKEFAEYFSVVKIKYSLEAMVAKVTDKEGCGITAHQTYLYKGRKANFENPRRLAKLPFGSTLRGTSIKFVNPTDTLCLAEGVETALSVLQVTGLPTWSTIFAKGLENVDIPLSVKTVHIFADKDKSGVGQRSAEIAKKRLEGLGFKVFIHLPPMEPTESQKGVDWNDVLNLDVTAFPSVDFLRSLSNGETA